MPKVQFAGSRKAPERKIPRVESLPVRLSLAVSERVCKKPDIFYKKLLRPDLHLIYSRFRLAPEPGADSIIPAEPITEIPVREQD